MSIVTLLTDFGVHDGYVGVMKGVIWGIAPQVQIAELTQDISPQDILEGAQTLARCTPYFPAGTVHIAVVDPGVGTERRPLAARIGGQYFVGPDNGLVSLWLEAAERESLETPFVCLDRPAYWLPEVSASFHGRDIFAPVGAHLANGESLETMGSLIGDPIRLHVPQPVRISQGWKGQVMHIDHFGNCTTNLGQAHLNGLSSPVFTIKGRTIRGMVKSYGERSRGELVAMIDSGGWLEIAAVNENAAQSLQARVGDGIEVIS